tara:strand:+ start:995 stop:1927 length:933 start_codon:yes stop_codon:yes gene_type:complete
MKKKKIYFIIQNKVFGTALGRGVMVSNFLNTRGYDTHCLLSSTPDVWSIKNSIVIFVKNHNPKLTKHLKQQNNKIVLDVLDGYSYLKTGNNRGAKKSPKANTYRGAFIEEYFDAYILSTKNLLEDVEDIIPKDSFGHVIYEKYDPQVLKYKALFDAQMHSSNKIKIGYIGGVENMMHYKNQFIYNNVTPIFDFKKQPKMAPLFNCHYSIRIEGTEDYCYKPTSKIATAAAVGANIIHTRDSCAMEIAGEDYPYYTNSDISSVIQTIEFAKDSYGSSTWRHGLEIMSMVENRLNIDRICGIDYVEFFKMLE